MFLRTNVDIDDIKTLESKINDAVSYFDKANSSETLKKFALKKLNETKVTAETKQMLKKYDVYLIRKLAEGNILSINSLSKNYKLLLYTRIFTEQKHIHNKFAEIKNYSELEEDEIIKEIIFYVLKMKELSAQASALSNFYSNSIKKNNTQTEKENLFKLIYFSESVLIDYTSKFNFKISDNINDLDESFTEMLKGEKMDFENKLSDEKKQAMHKNFIKDFKELESAILNQEKILFEKCKIKIKKNKQSVSELKKINKELVKKLEVIYKGLWSYFIKKVENHSYLQPIFLNLQKGWEDIKELPKEKFIHFFDASNIGSQAVGLKYFTINKITNELSKIDTLENREQKRLMLYFLSELGKQQYEFHLHKLYLHKIIEGKLALYKKFSKY